MRQQIIFTDQEREEFKKLRANQYGYANATRRFWGKVCISRGLDPETVVGYTALPLGHGKHWCYPETLLCKLRPVLKGYW